MQTPGRGQRYPIDWYHREAILASLSTDLPTQYDMYMDDVPKGKFVKLKISSFFLEIFCNGPCLKIRDGQSESSDLLKSFCGRKFESSLFSSGRHLWVRFHSPNKKYLRGTGFNAVFEAVNQCELPYRVFSLTNWYTKQ